MCILTGVLVASHEGTRLLATCEFCYYISSQFTGRCMKQLAIPYLVQLLTYINVVTLNIRILVARVKVIGVVIGILKALKSVCDIKHDIVYNTICM